MNIQRATVAFWDTNALVPLCCSQAFSAKARTLRRKFPHITIWWGTTVEVHIERGDSGRVFRDTRQLRENNAHPPQGRSSSTRSQYAQSACLQTAVTHLSLSSPGLRPGATPAARAGQTGGA